MAHTFQGRRRPGNFENSAGRTPAVLARSEHLGEEAEGDERRSSRPARATSPPPAQPPGEVRLGPG